MQEKVLKWRTMEQLVLRTHFLKIFANTCYINYSSFLFVTFENS